MSQYPSSATLQTFRDELGEQAYGPAWPFIPSLTSGRIVDQPGFSGDPASWSLALWGGREMKRKAWEAKRYTDADWRAFNTAPFRTTCIVVRCPVTMYVTPGSLGVCWLHVSGMMEGAPFALRRPVVPSGSPDFQSAAERDAGLAPGQRGHVR